MIHPDFTFELVDSKEKFEQLQEFAKSFDHVLVEEDFKTPIVIVKKNGQWIGYSQIITAPIMFSAWHKELCKPLDVKHAVEMGIAWMKINAALSNGSKGFVAVNMENTPFTPHHMAQLGTVRMGMEIYQPR